MKIVELAAENIKRIRAVHITPNGDPLVVIGGRNAQGKTSVLDAIMMALGGASTIPEKPVRDGEDKGVVTLDLGDIIVRRTFTSAGGSAVTVKNKDGAQFAGPQAMLDKMMSKLTFDPLDFARLCRTDKRRAEEMLRALVGLDTRALDEERKRVFDERSNVNKEVVNLGERLKAAPRHEDAPPELVTMDAVIAEMAGVDHAHEAHGALLRRAESARGELHQADANVRRQRELVERLRKELEHEESKLASWSSIQVDQKAAVDGLEADVRRSESMLPNRDAVRERMKTVEATNAKVRANVEHARIAAQLAEKRAAAAAKTARLEAIDAEKRDAIAGAQYPVDGLSFSDEGTILFNGQPFAQASQAEQIRVSVAMGLAANPKLRVLLVRDGNALDSAGMAMLAEIAAHYDAQLWVERVAESPAGVTVMIEDGSVAGAESVDVPTPMPASDRGPRRVLTIPGSLSEQLAATMREARLADAVAVVPPMVAPAIADECTMVTLVNTSPDRMGFADYGGERHLLNGGEFKRVPMGALEGKSPYVDVRNGVEVTA